jgi:hypothetical protein
MLLTALCFEFADVSKTVTREHAGIMIRGLLVAKVRLFWGPYPSLALHFALQLAEKTLF